jgi:hypothetical protein
MNRNRRATGLLLTALFAVVGCAPAYHWYEGCRVPCKYCAPCPLPYPTYEGCPCHSHAAEPYLAVASTPLVNPLEPLDDADTGEEGTP